MACKPYFGVPRVKINGKFFESSGGLRTTTVYKKAGLPVTTVAFAALSTEGLKVGESYEITVVHPKQGVGDTKVREEEHHLRLKCMSDIRKEDEVARTFLVFNNQITAEEKAQFEKLWPEEFAAQEFPMQGFPDEAGS